MSCLEFVEQVTEYLEGAVQPAARADLESHLHACAGCRTYLEQMKLTVRTLGGLPKDSLAPESKARLMAMFREATAGTPGTAARTIPMGLGDERVAAGDHIAYFWESEEDFEQAVGFLEAGLRATDTCFIFGHELANQRVLDILWKKGFDLTELTAKGRVRVLTGDRSGEGMLANIGAAFQAAVTTGSRLLRLLGNIGWGRPNWPGDDDILAFEGKVTEAAKQFPCVVVCMYDVRSLSGRVILRGGFQTHPLTFFGRQMQTNPHYLPVQTFLAQLRPSRTIQ